MEKATELGSFDLTMFTDDVLRLIFGKVPRISFEDSPEGLLIYFSWSNVMCLSKRMYEISRKMYAKKRGIVNIVHFYYRSSNNNVENCGRVNYFIELLKDTDVLNEMTYEEMSTLTDRIMGDVSFITPSFREPEVNRTEREKYITALRRKMIDVLIALLKSNDPRKRDLFPTVIKYARNSDEKHDVRTWDFLEDEKRAVVTRETLYEHLDSSNGNSSRITLLGEKPMDNYILLEKHLDENKYAKMEATRMMAKYTADMDNLYELDPDSSEKHDVFHNIFKLVMDRNAYRNFGNWINMLRWPEPNPLLDYYPHNSSYEDKYRDIVKRTGIDIREIVVEKIQKNPKLLNITLLSYETRHRMGSENYKNFISYILLRMEDNPAFLVSSSLLEICFTMRRDVFFRGLGELCISPREILDIMRRTNKNKCIDYILENLRDISHMYHCCCKEYGNHMGYETADGYFMTTLWMFVTTDDKISYSNLEKVKKLTGVNPFDICKKNPTRNEICIGSEAIGNIMNILSRDKESKPPYTESRSHVYVQHSHHDSDDSEGHFGVGESCELEKGHGHYPHCQTAIRYYSAPIRERELLTMILDTKISNSSFEMRYEAIKRHAELKKETWSTKDTICNLLANGLDIHDVINKDLDGRADINKVRKFMRLCIIEELLDILKELFAVFGVLFLGNDRVFDMHDPAKPKKTLEWNLKLRNEYRCISKQSLLSGDASYMYEYEQFESCVKQWSDILLFLFCGTNMDLLHNPRNFRYVIAMLKSYRCSNLHREVIYKKMEPVKHWDVLKYEILIKVILGLYQEEDNSKVISDPECNRYLFELLNIRDKGEKDEESKYYIILLLRMSIKKLHRSDTEYLSKLFNSGKMGYDISRYSLMGSSTFTTHILRTRMTMLESLLPARGPDLQHSYVEIAHGYAINNHFYGLFEALDKVGCELNDRDGRMLGLELSMSRDFDFLYKTIKHLSGTNNTYGIIWPPYTNTLKIFVSNAGLYIVDMLKLIDTGDAIFDIEAPDSNSILETQQYNAKDKFSGKIRKFFISEVNIVVRYLYNNIYRKLLVESGGESPEWRDMFEYTLNVAEHCGDMPTENPDTMKLSIQESVKLVQYGHSYAVLILMSLMVDDHKETRHFDRDRVQKCVDSVVLRDFPFNYEYQVPKNTVIKMFIMAMIRAGIRVPGDYDRDAVFDQSKLKIIFPYTRDWPLVSNKTVEKRKSPETTEDAMCDPFQSETNPNKCARIDEIKEDGGV